MEITIRPYEERDRVALTKCLEDLQDHEAGVDPIGYVVRNEGFGDPYVENLFRRVKEKDGIIYLAEDEGKIVGIIACEIQQQEPHEVFTRSIHKPYGYVVELFVASEVRNKTVGASLMAKAEEYFRSKGCVFSTVDVFAPNTRAHNFYKKNGYDERYVYLMKKI